MTVILTKVCLFTFLFAVGCGEQSQRFSDRPDTGATHSTEAGSADAGPRVTRKVEIAIWGDSWSRGQPPTNTADAESFALNTLLEKNIAQESLPVVLKWVGYIDQGQAPTNHRSGVGGTAVADHIQGTRGAKAFSDYWGQGKSGGCPEIFMGIIAHNDSVESYSATATKTGVVNAYLTLHEICPVSRFAFVTANGNSVAGGTYEQMRTYALKTAVPKLVAAGLSIETASCVLDDPAKLAPDGHPNRLGYADMAGQHVGAVMRQIRAIAGSL